MQHTQRFSKRVEHYVRGRPGYPPALIDFFRAELGLTRNHRIVDVGSGTGLLTELFLRNGNPVIGVEPNTEMRQAGDLFLARYPAFKSIEGTAEETKLPDHSADFIIAGQAYHWFDPPKARTEFERILVPGGWVALVWNDRKVDRQPFNLAYDEIVRAFAIDVHVDHHVKVTKDADQNLGPFFGSGHFKVREFDNAQEMGLEDLEARLTSSSYLPLPEHPTFPRMLEAAHRAFAAYQTGGTVHLTYATRVYYGKMT